MVVDDDEKIGKLFNKVLSKKDFEVVLCTNGKEALSAMNSYQPDIVITDLQMPTVDGYELTKKIKKDQPNLPVIIMTANLHLIPEDHQADVTIGKPFSLNYLIKIIEDIIN